MRKRSTFRDRSFCTHAGHALVVLLLIGAHVSGDEPSGSSTPSSSGQSVALNQPVSLDEASTGAPADQIAEETTSPDGAVANTNTVPKTTLRPRTIRRGASAQPGADSISSTSEPVAWFRTGYGALAIVLSLVGLAAWAAKRWMPSMRLNQSDVLRVVARANVTPKHSVALVHLGRRFVMVGVGADRLNPLCEITDPDEVAELLTSVGAASSEPANHEFEKMLVTQSGEYQSAEVDEEAIEIPPSQNPEKPKTATGELLRKLRSLQLKS